VLHNGHCRASLHRKHRLLPIYAGVRPRNWKFVALEKSASMGTEHY